MWKYVIQNCSISSIYFANEGGGDPVDAGDNQIEVKNVLVNRNDHGAWGRGKWTMTIDSNFNSFLLQFIHRVTYYDQPI